MSKVQRYGENGLVTIGHFKTDWQGNKYFESVRKKSAHFFYKEDGWAIDKDVLNGLIRKGLSYVRIIDKEEQVNYETMVENFQKYGKTINYGSHGEQIVLSLTYWTQVE